jgi:hypothetical protein
LIAAIPGKFTKSTFHVFCVSSFTHYAITDYVRYTRVESRIENYSPKCHRRKPNFIILSQSRPPQISAQNTSQATLQTQILPRAKPQSCLKNQKASYKYTKIQNRSDKQYAIHSTHPAYTNPSAANNLLHRMKTSQSYLNHAPATPCLPETRQELGKTKAQQPAQFTYESQVVKIQHPSATKKANPPSRLKIRELTT